MVSEDFHHFMTGNFFFQIARKISHLLLFFLLALLEDSITA